MEVHLRPELRARVDRAARENNSGPAEYVQQLVEHYVDHDVWFRERVKKGLDQLDRGEFLTHEERALESSTCSAPKCKFAGRLPPRTYPRILE
jgi:predicted transcriptional regulator